jgi:aspartyl protease family protein
MARALAAAALAGLMLLGGAAQGQTVSFNGSLGSKAALLLIDGEPRTVPLGQTVRGVKLLALEEDRATIESGGRRQTLVLGASPGRVGNGQTISTAGRQIVLSSGPGGHFLAQGSINGNATQFLVDTGATAVAIAQGEAERLGLKFREGRRVMTQTANGTVPAHLVQLATLRIGDVEVRNVDAIVVPGQMTHVLLGNSFLTRFQMRRENDLMTLDLRY